MIDFPSSPVSGQVYTYGGRTWVWDETGWQRQINAGQQVSVLITITGLVESTIQALPSPINGNFSTITYV